MWKVTIALKSTLQSNTSWTVDSWKKAHFEDHLGTELLRTFKQIGIAKGYKVDLPVSYELNGDEMYQTQFFTSQENYHKNSKLTKEWLNMQGQGFWPFTVRKVDERKV